MQTFSMYDVIDLEVYLRIAAMSDCFGSDGKQKVDELVEKLQKVQDDWANDKKCCSLHEAALVSVPGVPKLRKIVRRSEKADSTTTLVEKRF